MVAVVLDHPTALALYDPASKHNQAITKLYVEALLGHGTLCAPIRALIDADQEREGALAYAARQRFRLPKVVDALAATTISSLVRSGHRIGVAHAVHVARTSQDWPHGRFLLTLEPTCT